VAEGVSGKPKPGNRALPSHLPEGPRGSSSALPQGLSSSQPGLRTPAPTLHGPTVRADKDTQKGALAPRGWSLHDTAANGSLAGAICTHAGTDTYSIPKLFPGGQGLTLGARSPLSHTPGPQALTSHPLSHTQRHLRPMHTCTEDPQAHSAAHLPQKANPWATSPPGPAVLLSQDSF
jgi:hypothetical protein